MKLFLSIYLVLVACLSGSYAQDLSLEERVKRVMDKHQAIGTAVVVVKHGEPIYAQTFGHNNVANKSSLGLNDLFRIASISKSFTATAFMQLVDQGKVSLQDDFSDLIGFRIRNPKFPDKKITLEMILSHTSSIGDQNGYFDLNAIRPTAGEEWTKSYNDYAPGEQYQYCNLNYNMAGAALERLTGENFDEYIRKHILYPLNLIGGYRVDSLNRNLFVSLYDYQDNEFVEQPNAYNPRTDELASYILGESTPLFSPTGGMKISALDLSRYMLMHMNYGESYGVRILSEASSKTMQTPVLASAKYGLGLLVNNTLIPGRRLTGHTGSAYGLYSNMFFDPEQKFGFVVITNGCVAKYDSGDNIFSKEMINLLYQHFIQ